MLVVAVCFALGTVLAGGAVLWQSRDELVGQRVEVSALGEPPEATTSEAPEVHGLDASQTVLLVGDDSGDDIDPEIADLATGDRDGQRTDTIMVLRIDPEAKRVTGVNFPRDLFVERCDGTGGRINGAWEIGGPDCLVETVRDFSGITIDHYMQVDFNGFVDIVDAVGGVTMYLEEPMNDPKAHVDLPAGCVTLDGRSALGFVRTRADNDFGRIARQQRFLKELADEATSLNVLANPVRLYQTVDAVGDLLTMDDGLGISTLREFAVTLRGVDSDDITLATIPTGTDSSTGAFYERPVPGETEALLDAFKAGRLAQYLGEEPVEPSEEPDVALPVPLDELAPVQVLNASTVSGLAGGTAGVLEDAGIPVAGIGDATRDVTRTTVAHPPDLLDQAESLRQAAFPDAVLEQDAGLDAVTVLLTGDVDPDAIEVVGGEDASEAATDATGSADAPTVREQRSEPEYANAEPPPEAHDC